MWGRKEELKCLLRWRFVIAIPIYSWPEVTSCSYARRNFIIGEWFRT
jgi:hypothetical protein